MATYKKAYIYPCVGNDPQFAQGMAVQFNPSEITVEEAIAHGNTEEGDDAGLVLKRVKGHEIGRQWPMSGVSGRRDTNELTFSATLFFNTLDSIGEDTYQDVRDYIRPLYPYTNRITAANKGKKREINKICFGWGSLVIVGVLTKLSVHYTMFAPDGIPVRAEASISITGDYHGEQNTKMPRTAGTGTWERFGDFDLLMALYVDPSAWRNLMNIACNPRDLLT